MSTLILGPSCVGKSTLIKKANLENVACIAAKKVLFGFELKKDQVLENTVTHYNILHYLTNPYEKRRKLGIESDEIFSRIIAKASIYSKIIVLVAPIEELIERARGREYIEDHLSMKYDKLFWIKIFEEVNLYSIYESLFDLLDKYFGKYDVLYSSSKHANDFSPSDRVYVHHNLKGIYIPPPNLEHVISFSKRDEFHYQAILLPHRQRTDVGRYDHITSDRVRSFAPLLSRDLRGKSVLDVGSAMGNVLFLAERYGASRLLGIELNDVRYKASILLKEILHSRAEFINADFNSEDALESFDFVIALNIMHHIRDFDLFLTKAARLTRDTLFLEFPTFKDPKFTKYQKLNRFVASMLNALPVIGVSSQHDIDQSYIYSPKAIERIIHDRLGNFHAGNICPSPIKGRLIMSFTRV